MSLHMEQCDAVNKILLIGNPQAGKSSLLTQFSHQIFSAEYKPTVGVDYQLKTLQIDGLNIWLNIWDISGQDIYSTVSRMHFKEAKGIILIYDITNRQSFQALSTWLEKISQSSAKDAIKLILGNKSDLQGERQVSSDEGRAYAESNGCLFMESSVKNGENVHEPFIALSKEINKDLFSKIVQQQQEKPPSGKVNSFYINANSFYVKATGIALIGLVLLWSIKSKKIFSK